MRVGKNYFETQRVEWLWTGFGEPVIVPFYHRSLPSIFEPLIEAGFQIKKVLEAQPLREFQKVNPEDYEKVSTKPTFLCMKVQRP